MRRIRFSVGYVLSLGIVLVLRAAAGPNEAQIAGTKSSDHLDAVDLQRKAESALDRVQRNDVGQGIVDATYYIELAAHVEPRRAIPVLEAYFARSHEPDLRSEIASVLVSLGDEDPQFWNLILNQAQAALSEDPPDPFEMGQVGGSSAPCSSEAFLNWAKNRNLRPEEACREASLGIAQRVRPLADSGDRRVIPVLKEALTSRNRLIQTMAAHGLVLTGDRDAITLVIEAIEHAPQAQARALADNLIESDDPRAQSVLHQYLPDVNFAEAHQFRAQRAQWRRPILTGR
jgi:HEAT repeat protein